MLMFPLTSILPPSRQQNLSGSNQTLFFTGVNSGTPAKIQLRTQIYQRKRFLVRSQWYPYFREYNFVQFFSWKTMETTKGGKIDKEIFDLLNKTRADPLSFKPHLDTMLNQFDGEILKREGKTNLRTNEGPKAVKEAIDYLMRAEKISEPLRWSEEISQVAKDHVDDTGPKGLLTHESSDGKTVKDRLQKVGKIINCYGENLSFHCDTAAEVLCQLIVDDGVADRGHRDNLFNPEFKVMGCHTGPHRDYEFMTCIDLAGGLIKHGDPDPIEQQMNSFLKEQVEIEMPPDVRSWKQNTKVNVQGTKATKTITRTCKLKDGSEKVLTKTMQKEFSY